MRLHSAFAKAGLIPHVPGNMAEILTARDLEVRHNELVVLDRASLTIDEKDRIGMVGRNGAGKSTFLRIIARELLPDAGEVIPRKDLIVGYLPQDFTLDPELNVEANIRAGARKVLELIEQFEALPSHSKKHAELEQHILALDGWGLDHRLATAMARLNCPEGSRAIGTLS